MNNKMTEQKLIEKLQELKGRYILALYTDRADFEKGIDSAEKLLEIRVFDEHSEFRAYRSVVGIDFAFREINDQTDTYADGYFDETHYIDIDTAKTESMNDGFTYTIGGGRFHLPECVGKLLKVRYYYTFDSDGIARKCDWRLTGFADKEGA